MCVTIQGCSEGLGACIPGYLSTCKLSIDQSGLTNILWTGLISVTIRRINTTNYYKHSGIILVRFLPDIMLILCYNIGGPIKYHHEEFLSLQPMLPPKPFDNSPPWLNWVVDGQKI